MILPQTYTAALFLMILSMLCWGSWANTYKVSKWRFELYYFDFSLGLLITSIVIAFTVGSMGFDGFTFLDDMFHAGKRQWLYGFMGGVIFNLANMLLMAAIAVAGMAVAFPIGIGLALIIGVVFNYIIKPAGSPLMIFGGCALIVAAILVCAAAYRFISNIRHEEEARAGRAKSTRRPVAMKGVVIALFSGVLMGMFFPLVEKGKEGELGLGPYSIAVVFAGGVFLSTFVFNLFFMNLPIEGEPVDFMD
jgi:glucose uptake protein